MPQMILTDEELELMHCYRTIPQVKEIMDLWMVDREAGEKLLDARMKELEEKECTI